MSKATRRTWRKEQDQLIRERQIADAQDRERRLKGFKPANVGDMLTELAKQGRRA
jgi:hypothetical protein